MNGIVSGKTVDELSAYGKISEKEWNATFNSTGWNATSGFIYASQRALWIPLEITSLTTTSSNFNNTFFVNNLYVYSSSTVDVYSMIVEYNQVGIHTTGDVKMKFKVLELDVSKFTLGASSSREHGEMLLDIPNGKIYATYTP